MERNKIFWLFLFLEICIQGNGFESCETIDCISSLKQSDCPLNEVLVAGETIGGCCPGCIGGGKLCKNCKTDEDCAPGLKCLIKVNTMQKACSFDQESCHHLAHIRDDPKIKWTPDCNSDGTYIEKQCRGDMVTGRCYCFNEKGKQIFGWDWRQNAENMTCSCSKRRFELEQQGIDSTFHCQQNGNYENLQCDSGVCFCVDPMTGILQPDTVVVPENLWTMLPCYDKITHGTQYLRRCESISFAERKILKIFKLHGTLDPSMKTTFCQYDGSFGPVIIDENLIKCVWRDGSRLGVFATGISNLAQTDCACARDVKIFELSEIPFTQSCDAKGSYDSLQYQNGKIYCVDAFGYAFGYAVTDFPPADEIKCDRYRYDKIKTEWYC